jgi:amino acid transporter
MSDAVHKPGLDVARRKDVDLLHAKAVGLIGVLFLTLTGSAPITAMLLNVPIVVGDGNGLGSPAAFLVATVILLIFSVGYAAMSAKVTAVGGFYSFISHGLGRELGMAMGFASVVAYAVFEPSLCGGFAYFMNLKLAQLFNVNVPWPILALGMVALIAMLTYFDVISGLAGRSTGCGRTSPSRCDIKDRPPPKYI